MSINKQLIDYFKQAEGFISGEKISELLGISRTAVWKQIKKLQAHGYEFEAVTNQGYKLTFEPLAIDYERVERTLKHNRYGHRIHYYDQLATTQVVAKELAEQGAPEGTVVIAEQQLAGKGRMGRIWHSPYGKGIWMSIILRPLTPMHLAPQLTLLTAVALADAIYETCQINVGIKWPNDIMYDGKKLCGILLESVAEDQQLKYVIAGIGIDANMSEQDYGEDLAHIITSLRQQCGQPIVREALMEQVLIKLEYYMNLYEKHGFIPIGERWEQLALSIGKRMSIQTSQEQFYAVPQKLTERGSLLVKRDNGTEQEIFSAEMGEVKE